MTRALKVLSDREVSPQLGLLKSTLLQLDSTFSERSYGAGSFRDFVQKLEKAGVLRVIQGRGGWLVAPADGVASGSEAGAPLEDGDSSVAEARPVAAAPDWLTLPRTDEPSNRRRPRHWHGRRWCSELKRVLLSGQVRRWPLYLRNVKQIIRQTIRRSTSAPTGSPTW